eukprot:TRINITY_DN2643_c0_g2_i1.p1 TRINITY_DN2643_c0_g2~~TRINITY_DN2643_c0_g2_i1.p1  ORF type:complete len:227 (+),score=32.58 TRINITY_DN2643_c0_g2_i1:113-793(+)
MPSPLIVLGYSALLSTVMATADVIAQLGVEKRRLKDSPNIKDDDDDYDSDTDEEDKYYSLTRTGRFAAFGAFAGVSLSMWFTVLHKGLTKQHIIYVELFRKCVGTVIANNFVIGLNHTISQDVHTVPDKLRQEFFKVVCLDWTLWPPVILIQWLVLHPPYRFILYALADGCHDVGLSYIAHIPVRRRSKYKHQSHDVRLDYKELAASPPKDDDDSDARQKIPIEEG